MYTGVGFLIGFDWAISFEGKRSGLLIQNGCNHKSVFSETLQKYYILGLCSSHSCTE